MAHMPLLYPEGVLVICVSGFCVQIWPQRLHLSIAWFLQKPWNQFKVSIFIGGIVLPALKILNVNCLKMLSNGARKPDFETKYSSNEKVGTNFNSLWRSLIPLEWLIIGFTRKCIWRQLHEDLCKTCMSYYELLCNRGSKRLLTSQWWLKPTILV